jgi:hypothetical protein
MHRTVSSGLILAIIGLATLTVPTAAGTTESRQFERGYTASASRSSCTAAPDSEVAVCRSFSIRVFTGQRGGTDTATRLRGNEVLVYVSREVIDQATGQVLRYRMERGAAVNSDALQVRFDALRGASVKGRIRLAGERCGADDPVGECPTTTRRMDLDVLWKPRPGPASESFTYHRTTHEGCETTFTSALRGRQARMVGETDGRQRSLPGWLIRSDVLMTRVCS